jgi:hypothetical protein
LADDAHVLKVLDYSPVAMSSLWSSWFNDIDWGRVGSQGQRLSKAARQNLVVTSAVCALLGTVGVGIGLIGNYSPRVRYCDPRTKPCTKVEISVTQQYPTDIPTEFVPGYGLQRTGASVLGLLMFAAGLLAIAKAEEEQEAIEPQEQVNKQIEQKRLELEAVEELQNLEALAEIRIETHRQELIEAQAELMLERNPGLIEQYAPKKVEPEVSQTEPVQPLIIEESEHEQVEPEPEPDPLFFGVRLPESPQLGVKFWDWQWFNNRADDIPHIRIIAPTNGGKTTLCDWLADVVPYEERKVITVKRKPHQWVGIPVYGVPFEYDVVRDQLEGLRSEMVERTRLMEKGEYRGKLSAIVDEWKAIARNVKALKDEENKVVISPSAKEIMGDLLTLARESGIKIFALAQGRQVITWGLEGESDILDCFATVYLGQFAVEEAENVQRKFAKNSDEFEMWQKVIDFLKTQGKRAAWVETEFGKYPAIAPDLSGWKRVSQESTSQTPDIEPITGGIAIADTPTEIPAVVESGQKAELNPDELLRQNLDLIISNFERSLVQSGGAERDGNLGGNHPELEEPLNQPEPEKLETPGQVLTGEAAKTATEKRYTPMQLTKVEVVAAVSKMRSDGMSQTKIIESLWQVKKSKSGWSQAYREFTKELGL